MEGAGSVMMTEGRPNPIMIDSGARVVCNGESMASWNGPGFMTVGEKAKWYANHKGATQAYPMIATPSPKIVVL